MLFNQVKLKHLWRELLMLAICLVGGSSGLQAKIQFKDAAMTITHQPTVSEPYIVVDVLYFDAEGNDSYFTKDPYANGAEGPAVYVDGYYICSPGGELCWNTHQQTAEDETKKEGWWVVNSQDDKWDGEHTYTNEKNGITYTVKFWNPYKDTSNKSHYRVEMYVFLSRWEVGKTHSVRVAGEWKVNGSDGSYQSKTVTTNAFTSLNSIWSKPTAKMTNYNTVALSGSLNQSYGPTTVGIYTNSSTAPSSYTTNFDTSAKKQFDKGKGSFSLSESPTATLNEFDYANGRNVAVQYSCQVKFTKSYSVTNTFTLNDMLVYGWFDVYVPGFALPSGVTYSVSDQWSKKIKVSWSADESILNNNISYPRSKEGTWMIMNQKTGSTVNVNNINTTYGEIELDDYTVGNDIHKDQIRVYFVPKGYTGEPIASLYQVNYAQIEPSWSFSGLTASKGENGGIDLSWSHNAFEDASGNKTYSLVLQRSTDYSTSTQDGTWTDLNGFDKTIKDKSTIEGKYNDHYDQNANTTYYYRLKANVMNMVVYSPVASVRLGGSEIKTFTATRGNYANMVKLQWTVKLVGTNATNFIIQRRPLGGGERDWADIYATSGNVTSYSYDDVTSLPGSFNEYRVIIWSEEKDNNTGIVTQLVDDSQITDGFSVATGIISGNISYGTGTAVDGVKVTLKQQTSDGSLSSGMRSLRFSGAGSGAAYGADKASMQSLFGKDFSIQMYLNPDSSTMSENQGLYQLLSVEDVLDVKLKYNQKDRTYSIAGSIAGSSIASDSLTVSAGHWSHLSFVYDNDTKELSLFLADSGKVKSEVVATVAASTVWGDASADSMIIGNIKSFTAEKFYTGYIDEFRFWTKSLTKQEILRNYNHLLAGNESELAIYYPFDEGITEQKNVYDFSKKNGVSNGRHAKLKVAAKSSKELPSEEQLSLMSYTDTNGYYEIRGIPFSGDGTSYSVIPTLGIHEFTPALKSRYVSTSTLNHSGVDFEDVSSFPVSGTVFYEGTDYPVEGVNFYVDGVICAKDGEVIQTDEKGEFTISVPIGDHFITVKKNGHVFANEGRYPADPNNVGTKVNFNREIKNMEFIDATLVNFTGRVVGGDIEGNKNIGFGLSHNNIGVAELVLTPLNEIPRMNVVKQVSETTYSYETNTETRPVASATGRIASKAWRGAGADDCRKFIIHTDSTTGEFSALLPPLEYKIWAIKVVKTNEEVGASTTVDLTNPLMENCDTLHKEDGSYELYKYCSLLRNTYHSSPVFNVKQKDHTDGAFGLQTYTIYDIDKETLVDDIYSINNGVPEYKYGGAIFEMGSPYEFDIEAYELYVNSDGKTALTDKVPLSGLIVTIDNALSDQQPIYVDNGIVDNQEVTAGQVADLQSNQLALDSLGLASYRWKAGFPNISAPYTRTISMTFDIESRTYQWSGSGMAGVILGALPTGNNFVTSGPDMVDMILRDPPGTGSSAEWSSGTITSSSKSNLGTFKSENHATTVSKLGADVSTVSGVLPGVAKVDDLESKFDLTVGVKVDVEIEDGSTWSRTIETTKTISTSDAMEYVGAQGDVFVGTATNIIFGAARNVGFYLDGGEVKLQLQDIISTGLQFGTEFIYTQNYIENVLIPNLEKLRDGLLTTVESAEFIKNYVNTGEYPVYLTTRKKGEDGFGQPNDNLVERGKILPSSDGPSYTMIVPHDKLTSTSNSMAENSFQDSVIWCNNQIETWKKYLALNEMEKVRAYELRENPDSVKTKNYSFDSGAKMTYNTETQEMNGSKNETQIAIGVQLGLQTGVVISKTGVLVDVATETSGGWHHEDEQSTTEKSAFSYTLAEEGDDDALTVDVYEYGTYGPIFRTRGGQTSGPYEGKVVTKYYKPGTTIMEATMQIEVPQIDVDVPVMADIPSGSSANYVLRLGNASQIDEDVYYRLLVNDETNPDGANLMMDGKPITDNRIIKIPAGETITKALQLKQTNLGILDYNDIEIVLASQSQYDPTSTWDVIADTVKISAHFVPSSSDVTLVLSGSTMNTQTGTDLVLTFKDFDRNYTNLKAFRLQYKKQGATDWTQFKEYVLSDKNLTENNELLPSTGAEVKYTLPMGSFSDGDYIFRVVSASTYGTSEVHKYSDEIVLVKDMERPRPMGQPEPSDGILDIGDDLSVSFNEIILKGELTKTANFKVTGVLNGAEIAHETALSMQNTEATASTEANINLAGKDFSYDMWVNLAGGAGTLLSHGSGTSRFIIGTNADNKLVVNIGGNSYTSADAIPTGKWAFLTLSYKNTVDGGVLYASVADDANTTSLFANKTVAKYNGNGPLTVGKNITGAIHELLLWDEAHDMTTALLNRSYTKKPSTRHLIGYWKMDEGEGTSIRDYSRNRHMTMADATWYMNNENKSVVLNGQGYISLSAAKLPVCVDDDYALEFWMRGATQSDAQLVQMGDIALWVKADGTLQLTGKGANSNAASLTLATSSASLTDNAWHHIAVNVLRQGAAAVYVDGLRCLTTSSSNVGSINTDYIIVGARRLGALVYDRPFKGQIDEIRVWNATMNGDMLIKNRKVRLTGSEDGLVAYYAFEKKGLDSGNQVITLADDKDLCDTTNIAQMYNIDVTPSTLKYSDEAPAMRTKQTETNVSFTFVASNEKVVINIDEDPAMIEGCTLNFTVRDVRDENGNYSVPAVWSAFVNQNELAWDEEELSIRQEVKNESSVTAMIVNKSGAQQMWTLSGMPSWLTASSEYGTTNPLAQSKVTFTVSPATPIGKYQETIYLKSNNGIETPLTLNITVTGQVPEWSINSKDYEMSMNVIGRVMVKGVPMDDADDVVAAFIGEECRGIAHPVYSSRYDSYYVTMNIYGNASKNNNDTGTPVTFRAYDASTGTLYPEVLADKDIKFEVQAFDGSYAEPVVLTATNKIEQLTELKKGWSWLSFYVETGNSTPQTILSSIDDEVEIIKSQTDWVMNEDGNWNGNLTTLDNTQMYTVKMKSDGKLRIVGAAVDPSTTITVNKGWNWVSYYGRQVSSLADALADLGPQRGDVLKGQDGISYYDEYEWSGSLSMIEPGVGYMIKSESNSVRTFRYPGATLSLAPMRSSVMNTAGNESYTFNAVDYRNYSGNAIMSAKVVIGNVPVANVEIGVFADGECRAVAVTNENGIAYLTIPGDDAAELTFKIAQDGEITDAQETLLYETDAVFGTPMNPFVLNISGTTGIEASTADEKKDSAYDLQGRRIKSATGKRIIIINGKKQIVR